MARSAARIRRENLPTLCFTGKVRTEEPHSELQTHGETFATTHWSVVLAARQHESPAASRALDELCRVYWMPIYHYIRRRGNTCEDSQDLTQEFFRRLLARDRLERVQPQFGKFRSFLLASVNHLLCDEWDRRTSQKRGGGEPVLPLDTQEAESQYSVDAVEAGTAEGTFDRSWALALVGSVVDRLQKECNTNGKAEQFAVLREFLTAGEDLPSYAAAAIRLGMTPGALRIAVHRLRRRFGELFREAVANTVSGPGEIEGEIRHLLGVLSR